MKDFSVERVHQKFGGPIIEGRNKSLLLGKASNFGGILQNYALKLLIVRKMQFVREKKISSLHATGIESYSIEKQWVRRGKPPEASKNYKKCINYFTKKC